LIRGHDAIEEFLACKMYLLVADFGFKNVTDGTTIMSKVVVPFPIFPVESLSTENTHHFLAKVETDAEPILGSYGPKEHDVCIVMKLLNGGHLNRVFKKMGVAYAPHLMSGIDAFAAAMRKWKADTSEKMAAKKAKVARVKKVGVIKIVQPKPRPGPRGTSEKELALAKPIGVSKKFCFSDVSSSSLGQCDECGSAAQMSGAGNEGSWRVCCRVLKFASFGDSSPDTHGPSPLKKILL
jgi:hypothetical protein